MKHSIYAVLLTIDFNNSKSFMWLMNQVPYLWTSSEMKYIMTKLASQYEDSLKNISMDKNEIQPKSLLEEFICSATFRRLIRSFDCTKEAVKYLEETLPIKVALQEWKSHD
jgi:hypothetical protein